MPQTASRFPIRVSGQNVSGFASGVSSSRISEGVKLCSLHSRLTAPGVGATAVSEGGADRVMTRVDWNIWRERGARGATTYRSLIHSGTRRRTERRIFECAVRAPRPQGQPRLAHAHRYASKTPLAGRSQRGARASSLPTAGAVPLPHGEFVAEAAAGDGVAAGGEPGRAVHERDPGSDARGSPGRGADQSRTCLSPVRSTA
jgi:hypothetical protein